LTFFSLKRCSKIISSDGKIDLLTDEKLKDIKIAIEKMSLNGLRTISLAFKEISFKNAQEEVEFDWDSEDKVVSNLCFISLVGIEDPVRAEVPEAIRKCQKSGVVVRMITGDNINTARSIAIKCGIIKPSDDNFLVLDSKEFNARIRNEYGEIEQRLMDQVWPQLRVLARSSPQDKYNLVNGIVESRLSPNREVVAVTGDGTNDGPALKLADVGFAMGIQGTDVAKEASDIILTDDNFSSIVKAMMWGRNVYDSIAKFLQFQLTANLTAGLLSIICAASITTVPIKAVQMLWVNLVMDTLASLALGTESPTEKLLERGPYGRTKPIISRTMVKNIIFHSVYQLIVILILVWFIEDLFFIDSVIKYNDYNKLKEPSQHFTMIFNTFVLMTLFNEINSRKIHNERNVFEGILKNPFFYTIWIICLIGQIIIVNFGSIAFNVVKLDFDHWLWCFVFGLGSLLWGQLVISISFKKTKPEKPEKALTEEEITSLSPILDKKLIWLRSIKRVRQQLKVVSAFKSTMEELKEKSNEFGSLSSIQGSYKFTTLTV
jgi:P-type Ca2+ transporter type 2B